jgi:hypothetical protein
MWMPLSDRWEASAGPSSSLPAGGIKGGIMRRSLPLREGR